MLDLLADRSSSLRVRLVDVIAVFLWLAGITLLIIGDRLDDPTGADIARYGVFVGMLALATTFWAIAIWMVEVIRLEYEITTLRRVSRNRAKDGSV